MGYDVLRGIAKLKAGISKGLRPLNSQGRAVPSALGAHIQSKGPCSWPRQLPTMSLTRQLQTIGISRQVQRVSITMQLPKLSITTQSQAKQHEPGATVALTLVWHENGSSGRVELTNANTGQASTAISRKVFVCVYYREEKHAEQGHLSAEGVCAYRWLLHLQLRARFQMPLIRVHQHTSVQQADPKPVGSIFQLGILRHRPSQKARPVVSFAIANVGHQYFHELRDAEDL